MGGKLKKILSAVLCGLMFLGLMGCSAEKKTATPDLNRLFSADAKIQFDDFEADAKISRLGDGMWDVEFSQPKTLAGVKLSYNDGEITASFLGLNFNIEKDSLPVKSIVTMIINAIDSSGVHADMPCVEKDGKIVFSGSGENGDFTITTDAETGTLLDFELPSEKLKVLFENFGVIQ